MAQYIKLPKTCSLIENGNVSLLVKNEFKEKLLKQGISNPKELIDNPSYLSKKDFKGRGPLTSILIQDSNGERMVAKRCMRGGLFSISIAFKLKGETVFGLVLNPLTRELFTAVKGKGASLNGRQITVSTTMTVSESFLVTGFPYNLRDCFDPLLTRFSKCLKASQGVRRLGSAAIDLCFVACGRFDGFWEQNLKPWDTAAGELIAREAGAIVTDFSNKPFTIYKKEILATNGRIHKEMLSLLKIETS